jgi:hypothetical protein
MDCRAPGLAGTASTCLAAEHGGASLAMDEQPDVRTLAEGEEQVVAFLLAHGIPDFGLNAYLDLEGGVGRWPAGAWLEEASTPETQVTVTLGPDGVHRVEAGPADLFEELINPLEDDDGSTE